MRALRRKAAKRPYQPRAFWLLLSVTQMSRLSAGYLRKYTAEHRIFIYNIYVKSHPTLVCRRGFRQNLPGVDILARSTIHCLVRKFKTTSSVLV